MSNNAHELSNRLLNALDKNYNVVDMERVNEIISILEKFNITKELLETTRLGKHVNELRRKTSDPTLARRAKVLVKRWRDLVIPAIASPAHTGSNRSSAERQVRRLGGTPLTSPALSRHVVSPAVPSPRHLSRPAWGGYESDSQDVILVDDDPPAPPAPLPPPPPATLLPSLTHKPLTPPIKRTSSPDLLYDDKKTKRDKKPKEERRRPRRRGHSRAGSGTETTIPGVPESSPVPPHGPVPPGVGPQGSVPHGTAPHNAWGARNGTGPERRRNGWRRDAQDPYAALVNRLPPAGAKKVKTTKELLEQIQSRGSGKAPSRPLSPRSPGSPHSPDVMLIEPDPSPINVESPLRNGSSEPKQLKAEPEPELEPVVLPPLEDEREWAECTCGEPNDETNTGDPDCPAAVRGFLRPLHVLALHNALLPGVNGTRAPLEPHRFAVRPPTLPDRPDLFASVVPLYKYSDYADDYCVKNLARVPLCEALPWTEFAPAPPSPPPMRPYPIDEPEVEVKVKVEPETAADSADDVPDDDPPEPTPTSKRERPTIEAEMVGIPNLEPSERLKAPLLSTEEETHYGAEPRVSVDVEKRFVSEPPEHRTVERTKEEIDGRMLYELCDAALRAVPYRYEQTVAAPVVSMPSVREADGEGRGEAEAREVLLGALDAAAEATERDALGRPLRATNFAEWHECARLGDLVALPYVVID